MPDLTLYLRTQSIQLHSFTKAITAVRLLHFGRARCTRQKSNLRKRPDAKERRRVGEIIANRAPTQANKKKTNRQENINEIQRDTTNDLLGGHRSCPSQPFDTIKEKKYKSNISASRDTFGTAKQDIGEWVSTHVLCRVVSGLLWVEPCLQFCWNHQWKTRPQI